MTRNRQTLKAGAAINNLSGLPSHIRQLIDTVGDVLFMTDEAGYFTFVSAQVTRSFGYIPDDMLGKHFSSLIQPDWRDEMTTFYVKQFVEAIPETMREFEIVTSGGVPRWIEQHVTLIFEGKRVTGCCGVARDITERKRMENQLRDGEHLFRTIIENTDDIIFIKDLDGRHVMVNPAFVASLNSSLDNVLDKTDIELFGETDGERYRAKDQSVMESGQTMIYDDKCEVHGSKQEYSFVKFPLRSHEGVVRGVVGIGRDIRERKQNEEITRTSEERFRKLAEMTSALVFVARDQYRLFYANPALAAATGYTVGELLTKTVFDLIHPDEHDRLRERLHSNNDEQPIAAHYELRGVRKDGTDCWVDLALSSIIINEQLVLVGTGLDITERKRMDAELVASQLYVERINAAVPDAMFVFDLKKMSIVYTNQKMEPILGHDAETIRSFGFEDLLDLIHPDDTEQIAVILAHYQKIGDDSIQESTFRLKAKNGQWHWMHMRNTVFQRDANGTVTQILGIARDVTERKANEMALQKSEAKAQRFLEYLKALNEINIELSEVASFDELCRRAIELGRSRLQFDRLALFMFDPQSNEMTGTFGTDDGGNLRDERSIRISKYDIFDWVLDALSEKRRVKIWPDIELYDNWKVVGHGWNAMAVLLNGEQVIGWLSADNLIRQEPLEDYQLELLSIYATTLQHLCIRKRDEEALRASEERYRMVVEDQTELICRYLPNAQFSFANEALCRYYGKTREQLIGQSVLSDVPVEYHPYILDLIRRAVVSGQPFTYQHPVQFPNGELRWQEWTDRPIFDNRGNLIEFQSIGRDIEERRRGEAERHDQFTRLEIIRRVDMELTEKLDINYVLKIAADAAVRISHAQAGVIHMLEDDMLRVVQIIGAFSDTMLGSSVSLHQGIVGRVARTLIPELVLDVRQDPDYIVNMLETRAQMTLPLVSQDRLIGVLNVQTTEPGQFTSEMFDFLQLLGARIASAIDNARLYQQTEHQLEELRTLYQQVSDLEQMKTQMIRIAAHDLRNPLGVISGFLQVLAEELSPHLTPNNHEQIDAIKESVGRIDKITRDILTLERISSGQGMMAEWVDLRQIVKTAFTDYRSQAALKKHDYRLELSDDSLYVRGDRFLLPETVANLITNAIKYTQDGGQIVVQLTVEDHQAVLTVRDNGYGIPADQQSRLFQPFFRAKLKETRSIKGTGLGLHLVRSVIERHDGHMRFESEYGKGSTFGFVLPLIGEATPQRKRKKAIR